MQKNTPNLLIIASTNTCAKRRGSGAEVGEVGAAKVTSKFKYIKVFQVYPGIEVALLSWPGRSYRTDDPKWLD